MHAQKAYLPKGDYAGPITFLAAREDYAADDSRAHWRDMTQGKFDLHLVPGSHRSMSDVAHLPMLIQELEAIIRGARTAS